MVAKKARWPRARGAHDDRPRAPVCARGLRRLWDVTNLIEWPRASPGPGGSRALALAPIAPPTTHVFAARSRRESATDRRAEDDAAMSPDRPIDHAEIERRVEERGASKIFLCARRRRSVSGVDMSPRVICIAVMARYPYSGQRSGRAVRLVC